MSDVIAIVQARVNSTRLPSKILLPINGIPLIELLLNRVGKSKLINKVILATSKNSINDPLIKISQKLGYNFFKGDEKDVLSRYLSISKKYGAKIIVRITGDCPLVDPAIIDKMIEIYKKNNYDYISNTLPPSFPDGLDVEVFSRTSLIKVSKISKSVFQREHVTPAYQNNNFRTFNYSSNKNLSHIRLTVDEKEDLEVVSKIFKLNKPNIYFDYNTIIKTLKKHPNVLTNKKIKRNMGSEINTGQKLWARGKKSILNGNMLLSKNPNQFLPKYWPVYFKKTKGCFVWDLDDKKYIDLSLMGVGTNILGYSNKYVDKAVSEVVKNGNLSTLNCPEEVLLAEELLKLHPWAGKAKFARSGGEANAMAIRIARCSSKNEKIAFCGYHGWHDWYLAANISKDNLGDHLLKGLSSKGVPKSYKDTIYGFNYGDIERLKYLIIKKKITIIKMEVARSSINVFFLKQVRKLATDHKIVLIFDECTSGFREHFGGLHMKHKVYPDLAIFGKALGNGYAITAVVGKEQVMNNASDSFISSTFWTERIGYVAALKSLEIMEKNKSWINISNKGMNIQKKLKVIGKKYQLPIVVSGLPAICSFTISSENWLTYKTYITQEMLKKGFLSSNVIYVSVAHTEKIIDMYFKNLEKIFKKIQKIEKSGDINSLLDGDICEAGFSRLN